MAKREKKEKKITTKVIDVDQNEEKPIKAQTKSTKDLKKKAKSGLVELEPTPAAENLNESQMISDDEASEMDSESEISCDDSIASTENKMEAEETDDEPKNYQASERTVFVENLPNHTTEVQLTYMFIPYGEVDKVFFQTASGKIVRHNTYKVRSESDSLNAYVVMKDAVSAAKALALNGVKIKENCLRVSKSSVSPTFNFETKIFVGNLEHSATVKKIHQIFGNCGEIKYVRAIQKANKDGCIGTALVCFNNLDSVDLVYKLNGTIVDNLPITISPYVTKKPLQNKSFQGKIQKFKGNRQRVINQSGGGRIIYNPKVTVCVRNLKKTATDEKLHKFFSSCGEIVSAKACQNLKKAFCSGMGFVSFKNSESVDLALKLNGTILDDQPIVVINYIPKVQQNGKESVKGKTSENEPNPAETEENLSAKKRKSEFRGVATGGIKKQKQNTPSQMKKLANKFSPQDEGNESD